MPNCYEFAGKDLQGLLEFLQQLKDRGHDMSEEWWGFDDGALCTQSLLLVCGEYPKQGDEFDHAL